MPSAKKVKLIWTIFGGKMEALGIQGDSGQFGQLNLAISEANEGIGWCRVNLDNLDS